MNREAQTSPFLFTRNSGSLKRICPFGFGERKFRPGLSATVTLQTISSRILLVNSVALFFNESKNCVILTVSGVDKIFVKEEKCPA